MLERARMAMKTSCLIFLVVFAALLPSAAQNSTRPSARARGSHCPNRRTLNEQQAFGEFVIRTYEGEELDGCVQVLRKGRIVFSQYTEGVLEIGNGISKDTAPNDSYHPLVIPIGVDITGLGEPNVILREWSGGAHCCFTFHVLELGARIREVAAVDAGDSDYAHFEDVDQDGIYEFTGWDFAFAYWHASFLGSPAPHVVLKFNGKGYELATNLMRKPAPPPEELRKKEAAVRTGEWPDGYPPPLLWETMLHLIYTGHSDLAWNFVSEAWAPGHVSQQEFLRAFCGQLATSQYFSKLHPTIANSPCEFNPA